MLKDEADSLLLQECWMMRIKLRFLEIDELPRRYLLLFHYSLAVLIESDFMSVDVGIILARPSDKVVDLVI
jgi:hypothetical protein